MQANNTLRYKTPMKKQVDVFEYAELSNIQRQTLRDWWEPQVHDGVLVDFVRNGRKYWHVGVVTGFTLNKEIEVYLDDFSGRNSFSKDKCLPWLDIGQCIEFLREKDFAELQKVMLLMFTPRWVIGPTQTTCPMNDNEMVAPIELIDALWQVVKEALL